MAWLANWDKRIKLTADNTKVDSDLTQFPLTVFLKTGNGETTKVFDEITTNNLKMAVTKTDGTTELYVEIEKWDNGNQIGILHCGLAADILDADADTDYYLYYDNDHADNSTYIGVLGSVAGESVWDSYHKLVSHQVDATTSTTLDSTTNDNDGVKTSANNPLQNASGKIGAAQTYSSDVISHGTSATLDPESNFTISCWVKLTTNVGDLGYCSTAKIETSRHNWYFGMSGNKFLFKAFTGSGSTNFYAQGNSAFSADTYYHLVGTYDDSTLTLYVDTVAQTNTGSGTMSVATEYGLESGKFYLTTDDYYCPGDIDEIRYSVGICRSAGWIKAEYNSLSDTLLAYGNEELAAAGPANLKSYNGLAIASMKSIMGLGIADIKSINGLA